MKGKLTFTIHKKIKNYLVFFCVLLCINLGCRKSEETKIPIEMVISNVEQVSFKSDSSLDDLSVVLASHSDTPIIGDWETDGKNITFIPLLPFSEGETYDIIDKGVVIYRFKVSPSSHHASAELLHIYPTTDTVPENLLKMYFEFSKPMSEVGNALDHITVTDNTLNKEVPVFLELQSELWNKDHTILTLWLDPGRIKTDLIPNQKMGLPLNNGHQYTIKILPEWKDATNQSLGKAYYKTLMVGERDAKKAALNDWQVNPPIKESQNPLTIAFGEPMDYYLALSCFRIKDQNESMVQGMFSLSNNEQTLQFMPFNPWQKGTYSLTVESRLEDVAGNNLNHLFDTDLKASTANPDTSKYKTLRFTIE